MINHNKPLLDKSEITAITRVLNSGWLSQGIEVQSFENEVCQYLGFKNSYAVAVSSGTAALYLSLLSLDIKSGDEVIVPTYVCSAILNAIFLCGAKPKIVDIDFDDLNISLEHTKRIISAKTKAVILTHTFGFPAKINQFTKLGIPIIEDCAQSLGSKFNDKHLGTFGDISILSFYASKMITTGYGGMIISRNKNIINKVRNFREFDGVKVYKHRFNFQMSDLNASIGREQLKKLPSILMKRTQIANLYASVISKHGWPINQSYKPNIKPNNFRFLIRYKEINVLKRYLKKNGIMTIIPIRTFELLHRYLKLDIRDFQNSERVAKTTLSLPIYPALSDFEVLKIRKVLEDFSFK